MTRFPHFWRGKSLLLKSYILPHDEKFFQDNNKKRIYLHAELDTHSFIRNEHSFLETSA